MRTLWPWMSALYVLLGLLGAELSYWTNGRNPWLTSGHVLGLAQESIGVAVGFGVGLVVALSAQWVTRRASWARALHEQLRQVADGCSDGLLMGMALLSGVSEELVFRSWLGGWIGPLPQALVFAVLHQVRGRGRFVWMSWTFVVGLVFAWMFGATGSLTASVVAHVTVNAINLRFLRDYDARG